MHLTDPITKLYRITKPQIAALKKLGIETIQDLLLHFPYRYLDFSKTSKIKDLIPGENVTIQVTLNTIQSRFAFKAGLSLAEALVSDETGSIKVVWFNQGYLAKSLSKGQELFLSGTVEQYKGTRQLTNPLYEQVSDFPIHTARLVPVYHLTKDLYPKTLRNFIASVLELAKELPETLPASILQNQSLLTIANTVKLSHFPDSLDNAQKAKTRLAFEEIFLNQLLAQKHKLELEQKQSIGIPFNQELIKSFLATLPFELTAGQKKAAWDVLQDIEKPVPMNRLLEADVGSGKTLVSLLGALEAAESGFQVAFLAPTEILAHQHYKTCITLFRDRKNVLLALLTNNFHKINETEEKKQKIHKLIAEGMPGIYIGTHALLGNKIQFKNLAMVIIDEQHRFGVEQRAALFQNTKQAPHLLSLTATPIPRTLQLAYYGELSISQIKSKPANRKPILTKLVPKSDRVKAYGFITKQIEQGRQVFVITPLIEENESLEVKAAKTEFEALQKIFPKFTVGLLHGRLKGSEKERVMTEFLEKKTHILVSTSVVEVGVDVPNASVMVIEGAERFGLAQLHQFRGRVGRADHQSYCFLFTESESAETQERLLAFTRTHDGFALAELDLKERGFGELYGAKQSGWNFKYFSPAYVSLIPKARTEAQTLLKEDLSLSKYPLLAEKISGQTVHFE